MRFRNDCVKWASKGFLVFLSTLLLIFAAGRPALAQVTGSIRGTVLDTTGATIPGAVVEVIETQTGATRTATTASNGSFSVVGLPAGNYSVTITKDGFQTTVQSGIKLEVAQVFVVNATMKVGTRTQTVEVTAPKLQADTTTMQLGGELAQGALNDYPILNRSWINLQQGLPGVVASSDRFGSNFATNGNRTQSNGYLVNGTDNNDLPLNTPLSNNAAAPLSPDAIQEVKVVTNTLNPEYGRNSGAIMSVITKSGTNKWHGSAFEYYRNTSFNARTFFQKVTPPFHQNQFGATLGGAVIKNKIFGFFSYEGGRLFQGNSFNTPVFSSAQRGGDWSGSISSFSTNVSPIPLFSDASGPCPVGGTQCPAGTAYSTLFSTGVVPTQDFNPVATNLTATFVPLPNTQQNTFAFPELLKTGTDQYLGKLDMNLTSRDTAWFYFFLQPNNTNDSVPFIGANLPGFGQLSHSNTYQYTLNETHIFNSHMLNEFRVGWQHFNFLAVQPQTPVSPQSLGFTGINPENTVSDGVPFMGVTGFFNLGFSQDGPQPRVDTTGEISDNFSYTTGKHSFKFGSDVRRATVVNPFFFLNNGSYSFGGGGAYTTGLPGLDFQLGIPDSYNQSSGGFINARNWLIYSYLQDEWHIRPNLTMTYGSGWQINTPLADLFNKGVSMNGFRPGTQSTVFPTAPVGLLFPGDPGINSAGGVRTRYGNFAPRLGFAWSPTQKLSVRTGWGIYYNNVEEELTLQNLLAPPFSLIDAGIGDVGGSPSFTSPFTDISGCGSFAVTPNCTSGTPTPSIPNKYPFTAPAPGSPVDFSFFQPFSLNVMDRNFNVPYNMNYNLTMQYQVNSNTVATVGYVGSEGRRLEGVVEQNPYNPAACLADPGCSGSRAVEFAFPNVGTTANAGVFGSVGQQGTFTNSNYNALQATLSEQAYHGLTFRAAYTYSHALDNASSFENSQGSINPLNFRYSYGSSAYDARHRLALEYLYHIPGFGGSSGLVSRLTNGWSLSGVTTFQTGFPIQLTESDFRSLQCTPVISFYGCWDRPNVVGPLRLFGNPRVEQTINGKTNRYWFDPTSFASETIGTLGNAGRNSFHGPGINTWDFSFYKDTVLAERTSLQLRLDMFNVWNHAQFANPVGNITSSRFGQILNTKGTGRILQLSASLHF